MSSNLDRDTVAGFGAEWERFDQSWLATSERDDLFGQYFQLFPWEALPPKPRVSILAAAVADGRNAWHPAWGGCLTVRLTLGARLIS